MHLHMQADHWKWKLMTQWCKTSFSNHSANLLLAYVKIIWNFIRYSVQFFIKELGPTRRYELTIFCRCKMCNSSKMIQNGPVHDVYGSSSKEEDEESVEESGRRAVSLDVDFPSTKDCRGSGSDVWSTCCDCLDWFDTWSASCICWRSVLDLNSTSEERSKKDGQSKEPVGMMKCLLR